MSSACPHFVGIRHLWILIERDQGYSVLTGSLVWEPEMGGYAWGPWLCLKVTVGDRDLTHTHMHTHAHTHTPQL